MNYEVGFTTQSRNEETKGWTIAKILCSIANAFISLFSLFMLLYFMSNTEVNSYDSVWTPITNYLFSIFGTIIPILCTIGAWGYHIEKTNLNYSRILALAPIVLTFLWFSVINILSQIEMLKYFK